ncbi:hypothetical protein [Kribbella ginsengisoli]
MSRTDDEDQERRGAGDGRLVASAFGPVLGKNGGEVLYMIVVIHQAE